MYSSSDEITLVGHRSQYNILYYRNITLCTCISQFTKVSIIHLYKIACAVCTYACTRIENIYSWNR